MEIIKIKTRARSGSGKSYTRKTRAQGWIPAIYYGRKTEAKTIEVDYREFAAIVRNRKLTNLIDLGIGSGSEDSIAVIKEVQRHVIKDNLFFHIDFQHVAMNEKVTVKCPIEILGIPIGVKVSAGVLGHPVKSVMIECLPMDIPEKISIDVSELNVGNSIHVRDITIEKVSIKESPDEVLAMVTHPTRDTETTATVTSAAAAPPAAAPAAGGKK